MFRPIEVTATEDRISFCALETDLPLPPPKMLRLLNRLLRSLPPEPTPRNAKVMAKRTASRTYTGFALLRIRTKKSCWFWLPPEAWRRRPCWRAFCGAPLAFWACLAFTAARAMERSG